MTTIASPRLRQRELAFRSAKTVKAARIELRRRMSGRGREGALDLMAVIAEPRGPLDGLFVWQAVRWVPGIGDVKGRLMLTAAGIDSWCRVSRMTAAQREGLVRELERHAEGLPCSLMMESRSRYRICRGCGERMRRQPESGLCGFCEEGI